MTNTIWNSILLLIKKGDLRVSDHGYDELANDGISVREILNSISDAVIVEEYPNFAKGVTVLVRQPDKRGNMIHVVWGIPKGFEKPAVLITAYRPDKGKWSDDFLRRIQ